MEKGNSAQPINLHDLRAVCFLGIGGIGMSALARYCHAQGWEVSGYDKTPSDITRQLEAEGMHVFYEDDVSIMPKDVQLVIFTPAIPKDHKGLNFYRENFYPVVKRSDLLQAITANTFNICIAGTHGKTTITTLTAHILTETGYGCTAFLGGVSVNRHTNFWSTNDKVVVVEADEYDRSFHKLDPAIAVITAMDADHLDIYGTEENMQQAFIDFAGKVAPEGLLIARFGLKRVKDMKVARKWRYSLQNDTADVYASDIRMDMGGYHFTAQVHGVVIPDLHLQIGGMHNVENTLAAIAVAVELEIDADKIRAAVASFQGVHRRFEYVIPPVKQAEGGFVRPVLIDDYAHHPEELRALLSSVRSLFPQRWITVIFQPHLFTRTRDLADGFADALSLADEIWLLPIYPARELPIEGVSSEMILGKVSHRATETQRIVAYDQVIQEIEKKQINEEFGEVIVMAGAGDIELLVQGVKEKLMIK